MNGSRFLKVLIISLVASVVATQAAIYFSTTRIRNVGRIKSIGVHWFLASDLVDRCSLIDWGDLVEGSTYGITLWGKNVKNTPVVMSLTCNNWVPVNASNVLWVSWNYDNRTLQPDDVVAVSFSLTTAADCLGLRVFSFDMVIVATSLGDLVV